MLALFKHFADYLVIGLLGLDIESPWVQALHFFIEDTTKILILLTVMIYVIGFVRASMNLQKVKNSLERRPRWFGYGMGSLFGAITPFCSCSSIPLFMGFTSAGISTGVTLSFLITSPLLNEVALVLLGSILGWQFTLTYAFFGILTGVLGGLFFDQIGAHKMLQPMLSQVQSKSSAVNEKVKTKVLHSRLSFSERHEFALGETKDILLKIGIWVLVGVGIGAGLHGFVPQSWISENLGGGAWWSVPVAVTLGIPLYSNAAGMIPIIETLLDKGLPVGTALAFMLSTVGASLPEFIMLKQILKMRLLVYLFVYFLSAFTLIGWLMNLFFS